MNAFRPIFEWENSCICMNRSGIVSRKQPLIATIKILGCED
jgi:hypothetical protein